MRITKKQPPFSPPVFRDCLCPYCPVVGPHALRKGYRLWLRWLPLPVLFWLHNSMMHSGEGARYRDRIKVWRTAQQGNASVRECQRVEHENLIYRVTVTFVGDNAYAFINGQRHKVYRTGNDKEPWTTNSSVMG